jgi:hypothetical protein
VLEERPSFFLESWSLVIGTIFSAFVLFLPKGGTAQIQLMGVDEQETKAKLERMGVSTG